MAQKISLTITQFVGIVCGFGISRATTPRNYAAQHFSTLLGELGGYVAGLLVVGIVGAIFGLLIYAFLKSCGVRCDAPIALTYPPNAQQTKK